MADSTNPNAGKTTSSDFLPRYYRSDTNKKFLQATADQLIQPGTVKKVNGYIGRQNAKATNGEDIFLAAADKFRKDYQLEPGLIVKDQLDNTTFFKDYQDYINQLSVFGSNTANHARLNKEEFYSWDPHINWDMFVNFQNYYWLPYGPDTIKIYGKQLSATSTFTVKVEAEGDNNTYIFTPDGLTRNPVIKLFKGQTYRFEINSPGNPFSFKTERSLGAANRYTTGIDKSSVETGTITFEVPMNAPDVLYYQSEADLNLGGAIEIAQATENSSINVEEEIVGKKTYILDNGTSLSNGMKVSFGGNVLPEKYATGQYYVEGVGDSIVLINETALEVISEYTETQAILFDASPFDKQPFSDATAFAGTSDYILINRAAVDSNPWSRYNRWFHADVISKSAEYNGKVPEFDQAARAVRPIIEFEAGLKLFNFGMYAAPNVDLIDNYTTDVFSTIEGSLGYNVDGVNLSRGHRILFTADTDKFVKNKIYEVDFVDVLHLNEGSRQIHLKLVSEPEANQVVLVKRGNGNQGKLFWYDGTTWKQTQQKTKINQSPLFDVVDSNGVSFGDIDTYDGTTFAGTKLFSYKENSAGLVDSNLGFALSYKNINNIGDIVFNFNLATDSFQYREVATVINKKIDVGYLLQTSADKVVHYVNGWQKNIATTTQGAVRIYKNSNKVNNFDLDIFDDKANLTDLIVKVFVNGVRLDTDKWSLVDGAVYKKIVLTNNISLTDVLTIKAYAKQPINNNGYYEIPVNLQNNPLNTSIGDFTLGEVIDHVGTIVENKLDFVGSFPGVGNLRDLGNITPYGTRFVQHSGPISLSLYHVTSQTNNIVRAIEQGRDDYNKFKRNFVAVAETLGVDAEPRIQVDLILQKINQDKPNNFPYYFSDMAPYGASIKNSYPVVDGRIKTYPLVSNFNLDALSSKAVGIYLNGIQLLHSHQYVFNSQGFFELTDSVSLTEGDVITVYEYETTDGCFIPETPTKLGIWPKYEPKIYLDTSLITPRTMIQGHDGSQVLAYGDYRDDIILELEKRIYNNIKVSYDESIFDLTDIIPSYNRETDYSLDEFNEVLAPSFYKWTSLIDRDFSKPLSYDRDNPMTFNYTGHAAPDGRKTPGYWRGIYRWILDTDRPNICPWEMLGFSEEPAWWTSTYGPLPYTSDNLVMWKDISDGIVREPNLPQTVREKYKKPFLMEHIPVDSSGNILSPIISGLSNGIITASTAGDFVFGDVSPIEASWRRSSHYPFSILLAAMLLTPAKTFGLLLDRSRVVRNLTGQLVYKDTGLRVAPASIKLPSIYSSTERVQTAGIINYLVNYILSDTLKSYTQYKYDLTNLSSRLTHKLGGFTSKEKFNLLLDSKTPTSAGSVFVPQENYEVILNTSSPIKKIAYSAVVITKLQDGFEVKGYNKSTPYFKYYQWLQSGSVINVGGISESFTVWTPGQQYAADKVVAYGNRFYRVKVLHTTTSTFDSQYYQVLPALPMIGGREAILRSLWDRSETITVPYGTKFKTYQEVVDFLLGYGEYLKDQGFIFDDFNAALEQVTNWETSAKEFLFWTTQNWSTGEDKWEEWLPNTPVPYGSIVRFNGDYYRAIIGSQPSPVFVEEDFVKLDGLSTVGSSVISLSPAAAKITFSAPLSVVDDIRNQFNGYEIFKVDGTPIEPKFLNSYREDNAVSYTPEGADGIYGATFYLVQKEQVVILNNTTMFNDTIYNPESGYRQERIKVSGYLSTDWYGAFDAPGFVFDQAKVNEWEAWKDYALGDIVKHKEFYYSANSFVPGTPTFEATSWVKLDEKPKVRLLPNWTYKASQFTDFYSLDSDNFDVGQQKVAQHLIGYQKRQYLDNIIQDDVSEFKFYQGMIIEKGTQNVFNKLFDVLSADNQESLTFYEEWALRVGRYGASASYETIEFVLDESKFKNNPQGFELVNSIDRNKVDFIIRQTPNDVYLKPLGYNNNPWPIEQNNSLYLRSAGNVKADQVRLVVKEIDEILTKSVADFNDGDYIWSTFSGQSWMVYRYTDTDFKVLDVSYAANKLTITLDRLVDLNVGDFIAISQVTSFSGFYKVSSVTLNTFVVNATVANWTPFTEHDQILIHKITKHRATSMDSIDSILPKKYKDNELLWTDNQGNGLAATWVFNPVYKSRAIPTPFPQQGLYYGKAVALNLKATLAAVSTSASEIVIYDKASVSSIWLQRDSITKPFVSNVPNVNTPDQFATVLQFSSDSAWLVAGSPNASKASTITSVSGLEITDALGTSSDLLEQGVISLYKKDSNNIFTLVATITSPTPEAYEHFGSSIAFVDKTILVGAPGANNNTGKVYKLEYATIVEASASFNPVGSSGTVVALSSVANITAGLVVIGTGFDGQTVVSVDTDNNTITVSSAPVDPSGIIQFTSTNWIYSKDTNNNLEVLTPEISETDSYYGSSVQLSSDGSTLVVAAPGNASDVYGRVYVYSKTNGYYSYAQTLPPEDTLLFGKSVSVSNNGNYIAVSSVLVDDLAQDEGAVVVYKKNSSSGVYAEEQVLLSKYPETAGYFGSKISFMNDYHTLVVYSPNGDSSVPMTFNADQNLNPTTSGNPTTFDKETTAFTTFNPDSGRVDVFDRYNTKWVFSESLEVSNSTSDGYGYALAAANNQVIVTAPYATNRNVKSGLIYNYYKDNNSYSWSILSNEIQKTSVTKIKKAFLYNKLTNNLISYIDVIDPNQGKIAGPAEQEIKFKTFYDPATYSVGDSTVNVDDGMAWTKDKVGLLWWDLRTTKFIDSYDNDVVYRNSVWNTLAYGASVDIYEWVESKLLPDAWDAIADTEEGLTNGISGKTLYGNSVYSIVRRYDNIAKTFKNTYYYWVKNKKTIPNVLDRSLSAQSVSNLISNPRGQGYAYVALTSSNSFSLVNVKPLLADKDVVLSIEYWTSNVINQNIHSEWKLISTSSNSYIPQRIETKWFDSLAGKDAEGRLVPDTSLPPKLKYGIENRPRQSMFVNRFEALKQFVEKANAVFLSNQIVTSRDISALESYDAEPSIITGVYDAVLDTDAELRFANVGSFEQPALTVNVVDGKVTSITVVNKGRGYINAPYIEIVGTGYGAVVRAVINNIGQIVGATVISSGEGYTDSAVCVVRNYAVLVHSDSGANNTWSIYSYEPATSVWSRTQSQTYDTRKYWSKVDWYASGFNQFTAYDFIVDTFADLNTVSPEINHLVKVKTTNTGGWILLEKYADSTSIDWTQSYRVVGSENGTLQLSSELYEFNNTSIGYDGSLYDGSIFDNVASTELRIILEAIKNNILIDDLKGEYLNLFFTCLRYAFSEQTYIDWAFKTSFVKASHNVGNLKQTVNYRSDNLEDFENYVLEVKPFRTKVREYVSVYGNTDVSSLTTTDFDLPPVYENGKNTIISTFVNENGITVDNPAILTYPWKHWLDNLGFSIISIKIVDSGSGYVTPPVVRINSNTGSGASARAFISNGKVTNITLLTPGSGFLSAPTIVLDGGLSTTGTQARAVAIIGNGVTRSTLVKMKFDRITQTYFITQLEETESGNTDPTFVGTGSRLQFPLKWAPDTRIGKATVTVNGVDALRSSYTLASVKSTLRGYTSYSGTITFDTPIAAGAIVSVTYIKDWSLLNAADRIQYYYNPVSGQLGKDLSQLMTGIDYGGVVVNGLGFDVGSGWDSVPYYTDKWDSFDTTFDDYIVTVAANTHSFTLPYIPEAGTEINIYQQRTSKETYISDGSTLAYIFDTNVNLPTVYVTWTTASGVVVEGQKNVAGVFVLSVGDTTGVKVGDIVTTDVLSIFGFNTVVKQIYGSTDVELDQILFADVPVGTVIHFTRKLIEPTDVGINANGTILLTAPAVAGSEIIIEGSLPTIRLDDPAFGTNDASENSVMLPHIADGISSVVTIPGTVLVSDNDKFILRKSTSDGSLAPQAGDFDTALSGGDLAYSSATGLRAEDILVDGDGFVTPTSSPAPEEVVPGQVVDSVAIKVYDQPRSGAANVRVDNYISNGTKTEYSFNQTINSSQAVIVKVTSGEVNQAVNTTILTQDVDYTVDYANKTITLTNAPLEKDIVSVFSFGFGGTNILDLDYFTGDGTTLEFITKAPWLDSLTALVYLNGVPVTVELFKTDNTYDSSKLVGIRFTTAPELNSVINFVIVSGSTQTFGVTHKEIIPTDGRPALTSYPLAFNAGTSLPIETSMIVRANQQILKAPNNIYFKIGSNRLNYTIDPAKFLPHSVDINQIVVFANGEELLQGRDYIVDLSGITVKITRLVYNAYSGKDLIVSISKEQGYFYVPATGNSSPQIKFVESYNELDEVEVISSYTHNVFGIQRTAIDTTSSVEHSIDTVEYYNYKDILGGLIRLDRPVADDSKIWVVKNYTLLTPSVDFKLNEDKSSITLAKYPEPTDQFTFITFNSNTLSSGIAYMQFKDMLNRVHFKRLSLNKQTRLVKDLRVNDTSIEVVDASKFDIPNPAENRPGIIEIRGERIEYFALNGNVLSQLRRGTLGTGTPVVHPAGSFVQDIGKSETIPYTETPTIEQVKSGGTNTVSLTFVPGGFDNTWTYKGAPLTTNQASTLAKDAVEVFVGGYDDTSEWTANTSYTVGDIVIVGSYTYRCTVDHISSNMFSADKANWTFFVGNIRLKKNPYDVYNVNVAPESPEGDVTMDAEFAVDGVTNQVQLTNSLKFGTQVTVVKRTGVAWDSTVNIQNDNTKISNFLKAEPGIWYSTLGNTLDNLSSFDSSKTTFDNSDVKFDKG